METSNNILDQFINKNIERAAKVSFEIEEMMNDHDGYGWAEDTLLGIYDYIQANNTCTAKQKQAIENIKKNRSKGKVPF